MGKNGNTQHEAENGRISHLNSNEQTIVINESTRENSDDILPLLFVRTIDYTLSLESWVDLFHFKNANSVDFFHLRRHYYVKDAWYYNMSHKYCGKAIIFNHEEFEIEDFKPRIGAEVDGYNLEKCLHELGFSVTLYVNLTLSELDNKTDYWAKKMDYSDYDCFLMVILSHGEHGMIYAKDKMYKPEDKLWGKFIDEKCITLAGKPKLFFIQACRGKRADSGVQLRTQMDGDFCFQPPIYDDFLITYSTAPDFYSWRNTEKGSWFIQALCNAFNKYGYLLDLLTILTFVNRQVAIDFESNNPNDYRLHQKKEIPCISSTLRKLVKFEKKNYSV